MANDQVSGTGQTNQSTGVTRPPWVVPVVIVVVVGALIVGAKKNRDVVENPLVDFAVLTVGVFAFAAAFRFLAVKSGAPGLAAFFGGQTTRT